MRCREWIFGEDDHLVSRREVSLGNGAGCADDPTAEIGLSVATAELVHCGGGAVERVVDIDVVEKLLGCGPRDAELVDRYS